MDIGIFGGTFNPIHNGHLIVAEQIRERFNLARIYFVPSSVPPHKEGPILPGRHRMNMVRLATDSNPRFYFSSVEVDRGGDSYTIDTICEIRRKFGEGHNLYFIIGADAFKDISTWKDCHSLLNACKFIVISRPGVNLKKAQTDTSSLLADLKLDLVSKRIGKRKASEDSYNIETSQADIFFVPVPQIDISSTRIRSLVKEGRSVHYQIPDAVEMYIKRNGLYSE